MKYFYVLTVLFPGGRLVSRAGVIDAAGLTRSEVFDQAMEYLRNQVYYDTAAGRSDTVVQFWSLEPAELDG